MADLLDVPFRLYRGIKQGIAHGPEGFTDYGAYDAADRAAELQRKYAPQITAIRNAANSGQPDALPAAMTMLGSLNGQAQRDGVRADDWQAVMQNVGQELRTATRAHLNMSPQGLVQQAVGEGGDPGKLAVPLSKVYENQSQANLADARAGAVKSLLPFQQKSEAALAGERGAAAGTSNARTALINDQRTKLLPEQIETEDSKQEKNRRLPTATGGGSGGVAKLSVDDLQREGSAIEKDLADLQNKAKTYPSPSLDQVSAGLQARVQRYNEIGGQLNQRGQYSFTPVELRNEGGRLVVAPVQRQAPVDNGPAWAAATGEPQAAPGAPPIPDQAQPQQAPQMDLPIPPAQDQPQAQAPTSVNDLGALLGPYAAQLQQGQPVAKSALRAQLASRGVRDQAAQDQYLAQLMQLFGRADPGR